MKKAVYERIDREVARRYAINKQIGRGCYGVIYEVREVAGPLRRAFALKKVLDAFGRATDAQRTYREVAYMQEFSGHDDILKLYDVICSGNDKHLYMVTELMDSDLHKAIRCQSLKPIHRHYVTYQLLRALKYIHSAGVMHRDVKPANILLDSSCKVKLADFGWARSAPGGTGEDGPLTEYAATRWYRSPEILLGARQYSTPVDMWSLGCIVAEMHREKPLIPGTSTIDMLGIINAMLGKPLAHDVQAMEAPYASLALDYLPGGPPDQPLDQLLPHESSEVIDFVKLLLQYNPDKRLTAEEAIEHPYVGHFHDPDSEPAFGRRIALMLSDTDRVPCSRYRDQIYADVLGLEAARVRQQLQRQRELEKLRLMGTDDALYA